MPDDRLRENPLLKTLLARGAEGAMTFRGYVGPSSRKGYVRLYPRLADLSQSIEIPEGDIIHAEQEPNSKFESQVVWVKKDSEIIRHRVEHPELEPAREAQPEAREFEKGRLRIRIRGRVAEDTCISWCSCEICECNCTTLPQLRKLK